VVDLSRLKPLSRTGPQGFNRAKPIVVRRTLRTAPGLPKFISARGDLVISGFVSDCAVSGSETGSLVLLLRLQIRLIRVLQRLPGAFMSGQVTVLSVVGAATLGVGGQVMVFSGYLL
jgi:hypothetical protein